MTRLILPDGSPVSEPVNIGGEPCKHPDDQVERKRNGYRCKACKQTVYLTTVFSLFLTAAQAVALRKAQGQEKERKRVEAAGLTLPK